MSENVEVVASFNNQGLRPTIFKYGQKLYRVTKINLLHTTKKGASRLLVFNLEAEFNSWVLVFNTENLQWSLVNEVSF